MCVYVNVFVFSFEEKRKLFKYDHYLKSLSPPTPWVSFYSEVLGTQRVRLTVCIFKFILSRALFLVFFHNLQQFLLSF